MSNTPSPFSTAVLRAVINFAPTLLRQEKVGGIDLLKNAVKYKTLIKILVPIEDKLANTIQRLGRINEVQIRNIEPTMQTRMTILVVDRKYSLVIELKDDTKDNFEEAIDSDTLSNLFGKFVTRSDSGTGLGLYICKGIIEAHNGRIWAKNNSVENDAGNSGEGGGATFSFSLPLA